MGCGAECAGHAGGTGASPSTGTCFLVFTWFRNKVQRTHVGLGRSAEQQGPRVAASEGGTSAGPSLDLAVSRSYELHGVLLPPGPRERCFRGGLFHLKRTWDKGPRGVGTGQGAVSGKGVRGWCGGLCFLAAGGQHRVDPVCASGS